VLSEKATDPATKWVKKRPRNKVATEKEVVDENLTDFSINLARLVVFSTW